MFVNENNILHCETKTLYCLDPYILYRISKITDGMNDINNTQNPFIDRTYYKYCVEVKNALLTY